MKRKPIEKVIASFERFGDGSVKRFEELHKEFSKDFLRTD